MPPLSQQQEEVVGSSGGSSREVEGEGERQGFFLHYTAVLLFALCMSNMMLRTLLLMRPCVECTGSLTRSLRRSID